MPRHFKRMYIEITNQCNLTCSFCSPMIRKKEFMELEFFEHVLKQVRPYVEHLYLHVKGEPLLHPAIAQILDDCADFGFFVNLTTNGVLLPEKFEMLLTKPALRQINVSLQSYAAQSLTASKQTINALLACCKSLSEHCFCILRLWNNSIQYVEMNQFLVQSISKHFNVTIPTPLLRSFCLGEHIFLSREQEFEWPNLNLPYQTDVGYCHGLRDMLAILVDGTIVPCCLDADGVISLGNLHDSDFESILQSARAQTMYQGMMRLRLTEPLCQRCSYRIRFDKAIRKKG